MYETLAGAVALGTVNLVLPDNIYQLLLKSASAFRADYSECLSWAQRSSSGVSVCYFSGHFICISLGHMLSSQMHSHAAFSSCANLMHCYSPTQHYSNLVLMLPCRSPVSPAAAQSGPRSSSQALANSSLNRPSKTASQKTGQSTLRPGHTPTSEGRRWQDSANSNRHQQSRRDRSRQDSTSRCVASLRFPIGSFRSSMLRSSGPDLLRF